MFFKKKAQEPLEENLHALERKVDDLERGMRGLQLEWTETYDKVSRQMSRMAKRYAVDQRENDVDTGAPETSIPERGTPAYKAWLRAQAAAARGN